MQLQKWKLGFSELPNLKLLEDLSLLCCKPLHAWGLEFRLMDIQLMEDWDAQREGQSHLSWCVKFWPGLPLLLLGPGW